MKSPEEQENQFNNWKKGGEYYPSHTETATLAKNFLIAGFSGGFAAGFSMYLLLNMNFSEGPAAVVAAIVNGVVSILITLVKSKKG